MGVGEARRGPKGRERAMWFFEREQPARPHQPGGLRERCKLPQRGPGRRPGRRRVFLYSVPSDCLSQHLRLSVRVAYRFALDFSKGDIHINIPLINSWGVRSPAYPPLPTPVVGTHGNAVPRPAIFAVWRSHSQPSESAFSVGTHVSRQETQFYPWGRQFSGELVNLNFVKITA